MKIILEHVTPGEEQARIAQILAERLGLPEEHELKRSPNGKPLAINGLHWSTSHKGGLILIAISDCPIGADVEIFRHRDPSLLEWFTQSEYDLAGGKDWERFYELWTVKESVIKYHGGILDDSNKIDFLGKNDTITELCGLPFRHEYLSVFGPTRQMTISGNLKGVHYSITTGYESSERKGDDREREGGSPLERATDPGAPFPRS